MITVTKRFNFDLAHRLDPEYKGLCKNLHGHTYICEVTVSAKKVDEHGMIMDFGDIKKYFEGWIKDNWDHAVVIHVDDRDLIDWCEDNEQRYYKMPPEYTTTAESMVRFLAELFSSFLKEKDIFTPRGITLEHLKLHETQDSWAEWSK